MELRGCGSSIVIYPYKTKEFSTTFTRSDGTARGLVAGQFIVRVVHSVTRAERILDISGTSRESDDGQVLTAVLTGRNLLYDVSGFGEAVLVTNGRLVLEIDLETFEAVLTSPPARMYDLCEVPV
ncbi:MAG TPA: hypothetical protein VK908_09770 [Jiangellales bacterium]|nr:hypothetical protein [Jiangellales bacterium]